MKNLLNTKQKYHGSAGILASTTNSNQAKRYLFHSYAVYFKITKDHPGV